MIPETAATIHSADLRRILDLADIWHRQFNLPFPSTVEWLRAVYLMGYHQGQINATNELLQKVDASLTIMKERK